MKALPHPLRTVYQMAFVVDDLEAAAVNWQRAGAGPFYAFPDFEFSDVTVPDSGQTPRMSILLGYSGTTMIELMRIDHDPNNHFKHVSPGQPHHVAILAESIDSYLKAPDTLDAPIIFKGAFPTGTPVAFLDTRPQMGLITELITLDSMVTAMIDQMYREAENFTGKDLIRSFG